jgi:hypothetical protein
MTPGTYTIDQLAVLFQRSSATMRGYIDRLMDEHAFPARLPCFENLWSKAAVDRWLEANGQPQLPEAAGDGPASLARKYGAAA